MVKWHDQQAHTADGLSAKWLFEKWKKQISSNIVIHVYMCLDRIIIVHLPDSNQTIYTMATKF